MFENFFPDAGFDQRNWLAEMLERKAKLIEEEDPITPIELQRHLLQFSSSATNAIENMHILREYLKFDANTGSL